MNRFECLLIVIIVVLVFPWQNDVFATTATIDTTETYQTIEGFGASLAWWYTNLYYHPQREDIYDYLFDELGLDIFRLRNIYGKSSEFDILGEIVDSFYSYSENNPSIMISSWSPPADIKSNNSTTNGGTLDTTDTGEFVYGAFAQYWLDALNAFDSVGIVPEYISIQNEPDYTATWESCRFGATETPTRAGYDQALDSVYQRLQELVSPPKFLAPECIGIGYNTFQNYADEFNHDHVDGYAYHLYHGGDGNVNPDAFNTNLTTIANDYPDKPIFQTEYDYGGWFNTAWLIHNCLIYGNVSGYFYWTIVSTSAGSNAFIVLNGGAYSVSQTYWAFRQYSKAIHSGWTRIGADFMTAADSLKISAFIDSTKNELSIIILNVSHSDDSVDLDILGFDMEGAEIFRTSNGEQGVFIDFYDGVSTLYLPSRSISTITTLEIYGGTGLEDEMDFSSNTENFSLSQNYPNPFYTTTTIEYSIAEASHVELTIYDFLGRKIKTLIKENMPAGNHKVSFKANYFPTGIYFYQIKVGDSVSKPKRMILIK
jgi:glucuronoarabinoxylan endo-1,4-beta-xylanase